MHMHIVQFFLLFPDMASGRDGPIPYKAMGSDWKEFMDESDLPKDIAFQDPCKYLTDASNQILKLWRARKAKDEIPFKFTFVVGRDKEPDVTQYPDGIFDGLQPAGPLRRQMSPMSPQDSPQGSEGEGEEYNEPRLRKSKAAWSDDEEEEVEIDGSVTEEGGIPNIMESQDDDEEAEEIQHHMKKPGRTRRVISSEENKSPRVIPRGRQTTKPIRGSRRTMALLTPEPSQTDTPTPEPSRKLRSRTKPAEIQREPEATPTADKIVRTRSKGKTKVKY